MTFDATEASHRAQVFWYENKTRDYKERIMFDIEHTAAMGKRKIEWNYYISPALFNELCVLGYTIQQVECDFDRKKFKYFISWP